MITKTGEMLVKQATLTKQAINPLHVAAVHIGQNAAARSMIARPKHTLLPLVARGVQKPYSGMSTYTGNVIFGATKAVIPEIEAMYGEASKLGEHLNNRIEQLATIRKQGLEAEKKKWFRGRSNKEIDEEIAAIPTSLAELTPRDKVVLTCLARGQIGKAMLYNSPNGRELIEAWLEKVFPGSEGIVRDYQEMFGNARMKHKNEMDDLCYYKGKMKNAAHLAPTKTQLENIVGGLEQTYMDNPLTGNLAREFSHNRAETLNNAAQGDDNILKMFARWIPDAGVSTAIGIIDPATAALNNGKRFMCAEWPQHVGLGGVQAAAANKFVTNPAKKNFIKGLEGTETPIFNPRNLVNDTKTSYQRKGLKGVTMTLGGHAKDFADSIGLNPFTNQIKHLANSTGAVLERSGLSNDQKNYLFEKVKGREQWRKERFEEAVKEREEAQKRLSKTKALPEADGYSDRDMNGFWTPASTSYYTTGMGGLIDKKACLAY